MTEPRLPAPPLPGGLGYPLGCVAATLISVAAVAAGATTHPELSLIPLGGLLAILAVLTTLPATLATAATGWALHTGFVLDRRGELALTPHALRDAAMLAGVALFAAGAAAAIRALRARDRSTPVAVPAPPRPASVRRPWVRHGA